MRAVQEASTTETAVLPAVPPAAHARASFGRAPLALGAALAAAVAYAAFASGAISLPQSVRLEVGVAVITALTIILVAAGKLRFAAFSPAIRGTALLVAFTLWMGLSIDWSTAPDLGWEELNRTIAYVLVLALGITLAASMRRGLTVVALGFLVIAGVIALYALGGKAFPSLSPLGIFDLNHTQTFARLRAPFGYWNALALFCALAAPIALRVAADRGMMRLLRFVALTILVLLFVTIALTYSRGGALALFVAIGTLLAFSADRARLTAYALIAVVGALPALIVAYLRDDLTKDALELAARKGDGVLFALALVLGVAVTLLLAERLLPFDDRLRTPAAITDLGLRRIGLAAAGVGVFVVLVFAVTGGLADFTEVKEERRSDPGRVLDTNAGNRWVWWEEAVGSWSDRPLGGHGAGSFPVSHLRYRHNNLEVRQAHSGPLQFLSQTGLIGALLVLGALGTLGFAAFRRLRATPPRERVYGYTLAAGCIAWGVHMWVDWDWDIPGVALPLMLFLGVLAARPLGDEEAEPASAGGGARKGATALRVAGALAGVLAMVAISIAAIRPSLARDDTQEAVRLAAKGKPADLKRAAAKADEAADLNPLAVEPLFVGARIASQRKRYGEQSKLLREAVERQPQSYGAWFRLLQFQLLLDDAPAAGESLRVLATIDPYAAVSAYDFYAAYLTELPPSSASVAGTPLPEFILPTATAPGGPTPAPGGSAPDAGSGGSSDSGSGQ